MDEQQLLETKPILDSKEVQELIQNTTKSRLGFEMRWYIVDRFLEGVHFERVIKTNPDGTIALEKPQFAKGIRPTPIPRVEKQIDSILNILFFNKPVWKFYPLVPNEENIAMADKMNDVFDVLFDVLELKKKLKQATRYALKYNVGYLEAGVDANDNLFVEVWSPWNIYHDVDVDDLSQTRFLIKVVKKTIKELKESSIYNPEKVEKLKPETKESESQYYEQRWKEKFANQINLKQQDNNFVLLKEVWFRDGSKWYMGTECQGEWLREPIEVLYFPFVELKFSEEQVYSTSLVEKLIPLNRELDLIVAFIKHFIYSTAQGKLLEPKGSKIERVLDRHGERIRYEGGREPRWLDIPQLSPSAIAFLQMLQTFMDERGVAVLSFGKLPSAKLGWRALESLKQIELGNMQGFQETIMETLKKLAYKILEISERTFIQPVTFTNGDKVLSLISGSIYSPELHGTEAIPVSAKWGIKVEIESGLAYTEEGKMERLLELYKAGIITADEVREKLKLAPTPVRDVEKLMKLTQQKVGINRELNLQNAS